MLTSRRRPPAPPPPPPRRPGRRRRLRDVNLLSLTENDFRCHARYRCCCRRMHLRTASILIAILDTVSMTAVFGRGVHIGRNMQHNPMAISWFVASSLIFVLGVFCTLSMIYSVYRERHLCMLPMLVLKAFSVLVCVATTVAFIYMMIGHNEYLLDLVAEHVTEFDYDEARTALRIGGGCLVLAFALLGMAHVWFFRVLYRCYGYLQDKYIWTKCQSIRRTNEGKDSNLGYSVGDSGRPLVNGHQEGMCASASNSTAFTESTSIPQLHTTTHSLSQTSFGQSIPNEAQSTDNLVNTVNIPIIICDGEYCRTNV